MAQQKKGKDAEIESQESKAFESAMKQILSVPKKEIDRREVEDKKRRLTSHPSPRPDQLS